MSSPVGPPASRVLPDVDLREELGWDLGPDTALADLVSRFSPGTALRDKRTARRAHVDQQHAEPRAARDTPSRAHLHVRP